MTNEQWQEYKRTIEVGQEVTIYRWCPSHPRLKAKVVGIRRDVGGCQSGILIDVDVLNRQLKCSTCRSMGGWLDLAWTRESKEQGLLWK